MVEDQKGKTACFHAVESGARLVSYLWRGPKHTLDALLFFF